ncbi:TlpA disulfide reductase family protein [Colwellia sp. MB02u-9]|uniref:TlpA family protein disulfide reductase n=1 Tax=Colwellia sp. MB02u-9 TaxID=2759823 RepID=UPI001C7106A2|nr:TlpA disulfide reductase family protein [Colwellia sp. MB02u-9]
MIYLLTLSKKLFTATLLVLLFFTLNANAAETTVAPQAPAWQLKTQYGDTISSAQFDGQATILHFWATWCPYCKVLQPKLVELEKKYQQQGVKLVAISFNEDDGVLPQDELAARGYSFPTAVHGDEVASLYGVNGTPTTFFINKHKQVIFKYTSADTSDPRLELAVQAIVK